MTQNKEIDVVRVKSGLTHREEAAYRMHLKASEPPLSPSLQMQLFELYLNGYSCEQIASLNRGIRLGAIVRAFKEGDWMNKRGAYINHLLENVKDRVQQVQCEAVVFASDLLAVAHKMFGGKLQRYLQTGDESELGGLAINSLKQYKETVDLLLKLTGQDGTKKLSVSGEIKHGLEATPQTIAPGPLTAEQAAKLISGVYHLSSNPGGGEDE